MRFYRMHSGVFVKVQQEPLWPSKEAPMGNHITIMMSEAFATLQEMNFQSPYLLVMNKSESISDHSILPYGSIAISAKENVGISALKQAILREFRNDYLFCKLFIPYAQMHVYNANKQYLIERNSVFTDDGQEVDVVIPAYYADKFTDFIKNEE